jgi:hypothetical protein
MIDNVTLYKGVLYDNRHGGPFDRGSADSWYDRPRKPHYYVGGSYDTEAITELTDEERDAYLAGYDWNEEFGGKKSWD